MEGTLNFDSARTIRILDCITDRIVARVEIQVVTLAKADACKPITLVITSPGGSSEMGFALYDFISSLNLVVQTIALAEVASAAVPLFLLGTRRYVTPRASMFLHQPSRTLPKGSYSILDLQRELRHLEHAQNRYIQIFDEVVGRDNIGEIVRSMCERETILTAQAMLAHGIATHELRRTEMGSLTASV
jgi:ATP-dependent Clp protease, protease subunit